MKKTMNTQTKDVKEAVPAVPTAAEVEAALAAERPSFEMGEILSSVEGMTLEAFSALLWKERRVKLSPEAVAGYIRKNGYLRDRLGQNWNLPTEAAFSFGLLTFARVTSVLGNTGVMTAAVPLFTEKGTRHFLEVFGGRHG